MTEAAPFVTTIRRILATADRIILFCIKGVCLLCFTGLFFLALANVFIRFVPIFSLHFFDEVQQWLLGAMVFWGAAGLWMLRDHLKMDDIARRLFRDREKLGAAVNLLIELAACFFMAVFISACHYMATTLLGVTNNLQVPDRIVYLTAMLIPALIMGVYSLRNVAVSAMTLVRAFRPADAAASDGTGNA